MLTTCPECQTRFRVSPSQLAAKRGLVRCGQCRAVFNAYHTLEAEPQDRQTSAAPAETAPAATAEADPRAATPQSEPAPVVSSFTWSLPETAETPERILLSDLPRRRAFPWAALGRGLLGLLLLAALAVQIAFFLRAELASRFPALRPYLEQACAPLGCTVPLARERGALKIEASALETDPEHPARARLRVVFSNRAEQTLAWPALVLTLTDLRDAAVAQRVFRPAEYLPRPRLATPGLPARQEVEVVLDLDLGQLNAAGYRVQLEYF